MTAMLVVDADCRPLPWTAPGQTAPAIGEVCISGPTVVQGYHKNAEANESCFFEALGRQWFHTGDLGHLDAQGYLFLGGRLKELIKVH
jgi:acyl-CoA synthetase (AMP-forming)/AMP-acid ligase II